MSAEAARAIKNSITAGRLQPGQRLPPERDLAKRLGISRSSLRDALKLLSGMGLVRIRRSHGAFVARPEERNSFGCLIGAMPLPSDTVADLFEVRLLLESKAAGWAAQRASEVQLAALGAQYRELHRRAAEGHLTLREANLRDSALHRLIFEAAGNAVLVRIMDNLRGLLDESRSRTATVPGRLERSVEEMGRIVAALRRRDAQEAELEMYAHLKYGEHANLEHHVSGRARPR